MDLRLKYDDQIVVAIVFDDDGNVEDYCFNWQTGQNFALSEGKRVVAIADDGVMTVQQAQRLYDAERERYNDCFGNTGFNVEIAGSYGDDDVDITLRDNDNELVMWTSDEWKTEPSLVAVIVNAVKIGYTEGSDVILQRLKK